MACFSKINKRGGSNKAGIWENFLKKNKKNSMLIREFRVFSIDLYLMNEMFNAWFSYVFQM